MRAAVCCEHGEPGVVRVEDIPPPSLAPGQVRVRIHAAAVNYADVLLVANQYQQKVPTPFVPGSEFAGVVVDVADDVTEPVVGDRVFGPVLVGAFAEEVVVAADVLGRTPDGVDDRHASAFGAAHRTAYHVLRSVAHVGAGDEVIVLGAAGGVGLAAVQLGAVLGASVTAVASSPQRLEVASVCGARNLIDYRSRELRQALRETLPDGGDAVVDPVGGDLSEPALRALRYGGRFVTVGYASGVIPKIPLNLLMLKGAEMLGFQLSTFAAHTPEEFERNEHELFDLFASQQVAPHIGATFSLDDAAAALAYVADRKAVGKVVIDIARQARTR
ncbi:MAG: NADPH:quinone oxidoreductase family protein [Acidimicrobiia bacterium]